MFFVMPAESGHPGSTLRTPPWIPACAVAYLSLAPSSTFSIEAGKLPTLIGAGYTFSFQNPNIEHSLLWNQEPAISRGSQLNYTADAIALSFSWNDGFYSNRYTWLTGSATYTLDNANRFALAAGGNYSHTDKSTLATRCSRTTKQSSIWSTSTLPNRGPSQPASSTLTSRLSRRSAR